MRADQREDSAKQEKGVGTPASVGFVGVMVGGGQSDGAGGKHHCDIDGGGQDGVRHSASIVAQVGCTTNNVMMLRIEVVNPSHVGVNGCHEGGSGGAWMQAALFPAGRFRVAGRSAAGGARFRFGLGRDRFRGGERGREGKAPAFALEEI